MSEQARAVPAFEPWGDLDAGAIDVQERLGLGGMGEVRKGWDHHGNRVVALKLLRAEGPQALHRFIHEAKALASCNHPSICRVYGMVTVEERPCIVMQYVRGGSLQDAYPSLSVLERVRVVRAVAEALAHAHAQGLVHFDVKPSNVLVDQHDDGTLHPYLTDFGSARERDRTLHTMTATAVVTPEYMAPELLGAVGKSDARADVYGLGATLYHVLADRPPFRGSTAEVLRALARKDPDPLRSVAPRVHPDLARIVEASMRKDPVLRYASASAVAADLGRFLDGQPVLAPRPGVLARLASRARRNRAVTGVVVAIVIALAATAVFGLVLRARREKEAREAEAYLHDVEQLEGTLRQGAFRPLHDLDEERGVVAKRLGELEAALPRLRGRATVIVHYALGRGYLGLGDHARAREHLQFAWDHGEHSADLALALGRALGESYRDALEETERVGDEKERTAKRAALVRELRDPALELLHQGSNAVLEAPELLEAQIAFYEARFDDALTLAEKARARVPGLFEAARLEGDAHTQYARGRMDHGDYDEMRARLARGLAAYDEALGEAPSDLESLLGACRSDRLSLTAGYDQSRLTDASFAPAIAACDRALKAAPRSALVLRSAADVIGIRARYRVEHGEPAREDFEESIRLFTRGLEEGDATAPLLTALGFRLLSYASFLDGIGEPSTVAIDRAVVTLERASESPAGSRVLAEALHGRARMNFVRGLDVDADLSRAETIARSLAARAPDRWSYQNGLGETLLSGMTIDVERGRDPRPRFAQALEAYRAVQRLNPRADYGFVNACDLFATHARFDLDVGAEAREGIASARDECERGMRIDPNYADTHRLLAQTFALAAEDALSRGDLAQPLVDAGRVAVVNALRIDPRSLDALHVRANLALLDARSRMAHAADPRSAFDATAATIDEGRAIVPKNLWQDQLTLDLALARAEWSLPRKLPIDAFVDAGLAAAHDQLSTRPFSPRILRSQGALELLYARAATDPAARAERARAAADHLAAAISMNPNLARTAQPLLDAARALVTP